MVPHFPQASDFDQEKSERSRIKSTQTIPFLSVESRQVERWGAVQTLGRARQSLYRRLSKYISLCSTGLGQLELACNNCTDVAGDWLMPVLPLSSEPASATWLCSFQVSSGDRLSSETPHLHDACLIHVASIVPSKGLDIKTEFINGHKTAPGSE